MKKINLTKGLTTLALSTMVFVGCQKSSLEQGSSFQTATFNSSSGVSAGNYFSYSANDVCPGTSVTVTFSNNQLANHGIFHVQMWGPNDDDWVNVSKELSQPVEGTVSYVFEPEDLGDYRFRGHWINAGNPNNGTNTGWQEASPVLSVVNCCTNSLESNLSCGETKVATFTFSTEEEGPIVIQGGLTAKTTIISATSNILTLNANHPSAKGPANVTRWEGNVKGCQVATIRIEYTGGNGIGDWTAKRGKEILGSVDAQSCD
jgi:hypothetical protein